MFQIRIMNRDSACVTSIVRLPILTTPDILLLSAYGRTSSCQATPNVTTPRKKKPESFLPSLGARLIVRSVLEVNVPLSAYPLSLFPSSSIAIGLAIGDPTS